MMPPPQYKAGATAQGKEIGGLTVVSLSSFGQEFDTYVRTHAARWKHGKGESHGSVDAYTVEFPGRHAWTARLVNAIAVGPWGGDLRDLEMLSQIDGELGRAGA